MKKNCIYAVFVCAALFVCTSCVSTIAENAVCSALSGADSKGVPAHKKAGGNNAMLALTGETDTELVKDFFPTALKLYEIMHLQNPGHQGMTVMTGSLYVMYANAFVQADAEKLDVSQYDEQLEQMNRAKAFYLRGRDYVLSVLEQRYPGFTALIKSGDDAKIAQAVNHLKKNDVEAVYWSCAGWLGAFSLDPLNGDLLGSLGGPVAMLEKASSLNPDYNKGAVWDLLTSFYLAAPETMGGGKDKGLAAYQESMRCSGGKTPGPYITYAQSVCVPAGDKDGFEKAIDAALAINPDDDPSSRLATTISQNKARWLKAHESDYFLEW